MKGLALIGLLFWPAVLSAQEADLRVEGRGLYGVDGDVRVSAAIVNGGPDDVMDVDVTAQFDTSTVTASELPDGCTNSSIGVVCSFSEIDAPVVAADEELVIEFVVAPGTSDGVITLGVRSTTSDPDESNNEDVVPLVPPATVDVALDERGVQAPEQNTLVFSARNNGPDAATGVAVAGTVTIDFDVAVDASSAEALTEFRPNADAICGRQVPDAEGTFDRWTFPVSCSIRDLAVDDEIEFRFVFEQGRNAVFRLTATSDGLDTNLANNVTDGDFLNSPLEIIEAEETGCCATAASRQGKEALLLALACLLALRRRR